MFKNLNLKKILWIALILRLIAAVFAKGFGMHDDHFLVIEAAQSWVDGTDYNCWLPSSGAKTPAGHSFLYVGIHYLLLLPMKYLVTNPQNKMLLIRIIHAFYSLIVVYCSYKITERLSTKKIANLVGIILATFWALPWLSVRNLVEIACIPPLVSGAWIYVKNTTDESNKRNLFSILLAGFILGIATSMRFQTIMFLIGFGGAVLFQKKWLNFALLTLGALIAIVASQGIIDYCIWGRPFAEFISYVNYNIANATHYINNPWYSYLLLFGGILIPPISLLMYFGFFRSYKVNLPIFSGTALFFLFHSYFPNKQERFILPILPFFIILGLIGFIQFQEKSVFWENHKKLLKRFWIVFWIINFLMLPIITTMYGKRSRVESMSYLRKYPNIKSVVLEDANHNDPKMPPRFYLGQWIYCYEVSKLVPIDSTKKVVEITKKYFPSSFVLFYGDKNLEKRVDSMKSIIPNLAFETSIKPGFIDEVMYKLNPVNENQTIYIYRNTDIFPIHK